MKLDVVTQEGARVKGMDVGEVILPGIVGEMGILPGHKAMIMGLGVGPMIVQGPAGEERFALAGGFVEVLDDHISVLSETCERAADIDIERARKKLEDATAALAASNPGEGAAYSVLAASVLKATTRLAVAGATPPPTH
jgi:F-type H+-transporting ATPase subunit epsilon